MLFFFYINYFFNLEIGDDVAGVEAINGTPGGVAMGRWISSLMAERVELFERTGVVVLDVL